MTQRIPKSSKAQGACSRLDPQPFVIAGGPVGQRMSGPVQVGGCRKKGRAGQRHRHGQVDQDDAALWAPRQGARQPARPRGELAGVPGGGGLKPTRIAQAHAGCRRRAAVDERPGDAAGRSLLRPGVVGGDLDRPGAVERLRPPRGGAGTCSPTGRGSGRPVGGERPRRARRRDIDRGAPPPPVRKAFTRNLVLFGGAAALGPNA